MAGSWLHMLLWCLAGVYSQLAAEPLQGPFGSSQPLNLPGPCGTVHGLVGSPADLSFIVFSWCQWTPFTPRTSLLTGRFGRVLAFFSAERTLIKSSLPARVLGRCSRYVWGRAKTPVPKYLQRGSRFWKGAQYMVDQEKRHF